MLTKEEAIQAIQEDLAKGLLDIEDEDELLQKLDSYDIDPEDMVDILDELEVQKDVQSADAIADVEALNNRQAKQMANEDQTPVSVKETDKDNDGDTDKVTMNKEEPENDNSSFSEEDANLLKDYFGLSESSNGDDEGTEQVEDKPHDKEETKPEPENSTNKFAQLLSEHRY